MTILHELIAETLKVKVEQVNNTLKLLADGNTVPFIARYRKEMTNGLDEEQILYIQKEYEYQCNLKDRKEAVLKLIEVQGKLTDELITEINACEKLSEVEDIYRPYKQKKKTRATMAIAKGLEPLANYIMLCPKYDQLEKKVNEVLSEQCDNYAEAIQGALDIISERVADQAKLRWKVKESILHYGRIETQAKKKHDDQEQKYKMYYEYSERVSTIASHRIMAIDRAEKEKVITVSFNYNEEYLQNYALRGITRNRETAVLELLTQAVNDGLKRLLFPSVEREVRSELTTAAQEKSINIFSLNLEKLLLQPPMANKKVLGFDPAFRTGCKLAVLDVTGKPLTISVIYPHPPVNKKQQAEKILVDLIKKYAIDIIAIGNGTASRESESFVAEVIKNNNLNVQYTIVSEAGASVYSASEIARAEFPDLHVEQRSAISIGRRLQDPLAELIKIDPKSIGVGQYQHDLPKKELTEKLDFAVLKSVNRVGVDLNTASMELLCHVSGLTKSSAKQIIEFRNTNGLFSNRQQLLSVKKLGKKTFEQCAGFLRIKNGENQFDQTSIHPESYAIAKKIMDLHQIKQLGSDIEIDVLKTAEQLNTDQFTIQDVVDAIKQPLRDYREKYDGPILRSDVLEIDDLKVNDQLEGVVRNVVDFGAFIDIGLHEDGLLHISKMSNQKRINHPADLLAVGDIVKVFVYNIDKERHKVQLSLFRA